MLEINTTMVWFQTMIKQISYNTIYDIWSNELWPNRTSKIESNSAMVYLGGFDMANMHTEPLFFGYFSNGTLAGVNSGHKCIDNSYRSRGLFVFPEFRNNGIGYKLLKATIEEATNQGATFVWSLPRKNSWETYKKAGFILTSAWGKTETYVENAYCAFYIN